MAVKGPPVRSIGDIVPMFAGHICQTRLASCHSDLPIKFQFEGREMDGRKHRWNDSMDGSENETSGILLACESVSSVAFKSDTIFHTCFLSRFG